MIEHNNIAHEKWYDSDQICSLSIRRVRSHSCVDKTQSFNKSNKLQWTSTSFAQCRLYYPESYHVNAHLFGCILLIRNLLQVALGYKNKQTVRRDKLGGLASCNVTVKMTSPSSVCICRSATSRIQNVTQVRTEFSIQSSN